MYLYVHVYIYIYMLVLGPLTCVRRNAELQRLKALYLASFFQTSS